MNYIGVFIDFEDQIEFETPVEYGRNIIVAPILRNIKYEKDDSKDHFTDRIRYKVYLLDRSETDLRQMILNRKDLLFYRRTE